METQINFFSVLPPQIISEITSRLPIKSIIDCTLVCKLWHTLISNPFVAKSDTHFLFHNDDSPKFAMLADESRENLIVPENLILMKHPSLPSHFRHGEQKLVPIDHFRVHSCNGLVCFSVNNNADVYLYNPILGECVYVPKPSINELYFDTYELGFCPSSNQYKLMRFMKFDGDTTELEIYTLGSSDGWRRHNGDVPSQIWNKSEGAICARGVLHWLVNPNKKFERSILTFDVEKEEFGSLPLPFLDDDKEIYKLGYMDGCLVFTVGHKPALGLEIWAARKEYYRVEVEVEGPVWTKNWVVDATDSLNQKIMDPYKLTCLIPTKLSTDGRIFLTYLDEQVYCYDPSHKLVTGLVFSREYFGSKWPGLVAHTASLVSPKKLMQGETYRKGKRKLIY